MMKYLLLFLLVSNIFLKPIPEKPPRDEESSFKKPLLEYSSRHGRNLLEDESKLNDLISHLKTLNIKNMYENDFFLTWDKTEDELKAIWLVADILRYLRENNISTKIFSSGLAISIFRDNSTRTRFSFASACNLLGLVVQDLDEKKSQIAHGETVRETANMVSFMADAIGIRDDMYIGKGHTYQKEVVDAVTQGYKDGILEQKPTLVNLQCDIDHPTQIMADALHIIHKFIPLLMENL